MRELVSDVMMPVRYRPMSCPRRYYGAFPTLVPYLVQIYLAAYSDLVVGLSYRQILRREAHSPIRPTLPASPMLAFPLPNHYRKSIRNLDR